MDLPAGKKTIGCKWIYKVKLKTNGEIERFKVRLVAKGYTQKEEIDFKETFSPVAKMVTIRTVLWVAAQFDWPLYHLDVNNAFLNGDLFEEVYMDILLGFCNLERLRKVCRLLKSLYGLKQASRQWNLKFTQTLTNSRYVQSKLNYSLFTKKTSSGIIVFFYLCR